MVETLWIVRRRFRVGRLYGGALLECHSDPFVERGRRGEARHASRARNDDRPDNNRNHGRPRPQSYSAAHGPRRAGGIRYIGVKRVLVSWSSGKDSAWTLHVLRRQPEIEICGLVTTFNNAADRVAMHAVRRSLVEMQADRAGLPLWPVELPWPCSNNEYESRMRAVCERAIAEKIDAIAFGDLFLEDI